MSTVIGAMEAYLKLNIDDFESNLAAAKKQVESVSAGFDVLTSVGDKMTKVGKSLTLGVTTPVLALGTACVKTTADFDATMSKVSAISGATGEDLEALRDKAKEMGEQTKFSASEAGSAFTYMAMAGWDTQQMLDGISGIMSLAAADGLDLATTSDIVTDALTAFGLQAADAGHFADVLAKASSSANTNVSMLGESFKYVAPVAGSMGYSVEDVAVALGLMANSGIKAGQAGTAMRAALTRMAKPTGDAAAVMEQYGISISNSDGSMKSLSEVMVMLRKNMGSLTEAEQIQAATTIFGQEAMSGMLAIINASDTDFDKLTNSINNADGTAKSMADTMANNLNGQMTLLKSQLESLAISFGEMIIPVVRQVVSWIQKLVDKLNSMDEGTRKVVLTIAMVAAAIGPVLMVLGKTISTIGKVGSAISNIKALLTALQGSLAAAGTSIGAIAGPVLAIVAVIAVLAAAFKHLWETNEEFRNKMTAIWDGLVGKFKEFCQGIVERINALGFDFENIGEVLKAIWEGFCNLLGPMFETAWANIVNTLSLAMDLIMGVLDIFIGIFTGDWERVWDGVKGIFVGIWDYIKNFFTNCLTGMFDFTNVILGWFGTSWEQIWTAIRDFFVNIWNGIVEFFTGIGEWLKNAWTSLGNFFTNLWNGIATFFVNLWTNIKNGVTNIVSGFVNTLKGYFDGFGSSVKGIFNGIKDFFVNIWTVIKNFFGGIVLAIIDLVTGNFEQLKSDISNVMENIRQAISNIWTAIKNIFTNTINAIKTFVTGAWNMIKDGTTTAWNAVKNAVSTAVNAIKNAVTTAFNAVKNTVTTVFTNIKNTISNLVNGAKNAAVNAFNAMKTGVSTAVTNVKNAIVNGITAAVNWIKNLPSQALTWGKDMIMGMVNGIKSCISKVGDAVKSVADKIRNFLHFSRPDVGPLREYETWMPDMIDGLSKTLASASPSLIDKVRALSGNMADALNGGNYQLALAGAGADIRAGGTAMATNNYSALNRTSEPQVVEKTEIHIDKIEVRDDHDLDVVTQGLYNKQDQNLRALGRRNV